MYENQVTEVKILSVSSANPVNPAIEWVFYEKINDNILQFIHYHKLHLIIYEKFIMVSQIYFIFNQFRFNNSPFYI